VVRLHGNFSCSAVHEDGYRFLRATTVRPHGASGFVTELLHLDRKTVRVITLDAIYVNATFNLKRSSIHGTTVLLLHEEELLAAGDAYGVWFIAEVLAPEQLAIALIIDRSHEGNMYGIVPAASQ